MYYFNDTNLQDLADLESELAKKEIFLQEVVNVIKPGVDCLAYKKIYPDGDNVVSLMYVLDRTDVVDHNGRSQYNGVIASYRERKNGTLEDYTLNHSKFENANYLGLWLLIVATNQTVVDGEENYESIKDALEAE